MKIVDADPSFTDDGFGKAVEINKSDVGSLQKVQAIIDFARKEGFGEPIIDQGAGESILVQLEEEDDQYVCPMRNAHELKDSLEELFGVNKL